MATGSCQIVPLLAALLLVWLSMGSILQYLVETLDTGEVLLVDHAHHAGQHGRSVEGASQAPEQQRGEDVERSLFQGLVRIPSQSPPAALSPQEVT